jgi:hypothetical protein
MRAPRGSASIAVVALSFAPIGCSTVTVREANAAGGRIEIESESPNLDAANYLTKACPRGYRIVSEEDALGPEPEGASIPIVRDKQGNAIVSVEPGRKVTKEIAYVCDHPTEIGARVSR